MQPKKIRKKIKNGQRRRRAGYGSKVGGRPPIPPHPHTEHTKAQESLNLPLYKAVNGLKRLQTCNLPQKGK